MFVHNKTLDWLAGKTDNEKEILLSKARKNVSTIRLKFKERMKQLEIKRRLNLEEKLRKAENVEKKKRIQKLQDYTSKIITWGLWQSDEQVNFNLNLCTSKNDKIEALKAQLNFRRYVLAQNPKTDDFKDVYLMSKSHGNGNRRINLTS